MQGSGENAKKMSIIREVGNPKGYACNKHRWNNGSKGRI